MSTSLAIMSSTVKELAIKKNTRATRAHSTTKLICWPSWYNIITGCTKTERLLVRVNKSCLQGPQQLGEDIITFLTDKTEPVEKNSDKIRGTLHVLLALPSRWVCATSTRARHVATSMLAQYML